MFPAAHGLAIRRIDGSVEQPEIVTRVQIWTRVQLRAQAGFDTRTAMSGYRRPLPQPDRETSFYWEAARRHELAILRCDRCGYYIHYPRAECPRCGASSLHPGRMSGRGTVHSFTVTHYVSAPGFEDAIPFVVALIELAEQPNLRITANLRDCPPLAVRIGMPVEVVFDDVTPEITLPQFRPRQ